jgi:hypothetical protein
VADHAWRTAGTGGGTIGADIDGIITGTTGVITGVPVEFPTFSTLTLPGGTEQAVYSAEVITTGGTGAHTLTVTSGTLPTGLTLTKNVISGTPTTAATYTFTITATDVLSASSSKDYSIVIAAASLGTVTITTTDADLSDATTIEDYSETLTATGGSATYVWSLVDGSGILPPGLALSATGTIAGRATSPGVFAFTILVTSGAISDTETYTISVTTGGTPVDPIGGKRRPKNWSGQERYSYRRDDCSALTTADDGVRVRDVCIDSNNVTWTVTATSPTVTVKDIRLPDRATTTVDGATTFAVTTTYHIVLACTGAETINTITGGVAGMLLTIEHTDTDCTFADDDSATATDAIDLTGTATNDVGAVNKMIGLIYNGTHWLQLYESDN